MRFKGCFVTEKESGGHTQITVTRKPQKKVSSMLNRGFAHTSVQSRLVGKKHIAQLISKKN
nr:uncharacterized protein SPAC27E2.13 [Schizosaccharomyces pombe]A6X977.1 RecName: Full=Putative uncharacterized protein SPAC27E2.13 [Schizosaccharomyces pombe 972h-]CAO77645.1 dubious [Schizosaccharomyces pombe]|eukprot:NP_001343036.1 uncharacterized protein SPAC27E2.13 [Schizosaccharomyces pombe]